MEPRIQYARTSDGVSIAYAVLGDGPPIVYTTAGFGGLHLYSSRMPPGAAQNTDTIVRLGWRVIIYDGRGMGSSERDNTDFSLEARLRDLDAVIERAAVDRFALQGALGAGLTAIAYAAKHPERVSRLLLLAAFANGSDYYNQIPAGQATRATITFAQEQWEYYTLAYANAAIGFTDSELANRFAAAMRSGMSARAFLLNLAAYEKTDVTDLLPLVNVPTLVVHTEQLPLSNLDLLRVLASRIPDARLVRLAAPEEFPRTVDAFLREGEEQPPPPQPTLPHGTAVILFADIVDSTALTERLGDAAFRAKARELGPALRALVRECGGTPVEGPTLGDGVLAVFTSAREAIEAARRCAKAGDDAALPLHLGLHAGDVTREKDPDGRDNVYGGAVNIAARISGLSAPGEVLVSDTVRSLARTSAGVTFDDRGEQSLKGVGEPVRVWAVVPSAGRASA